MFWYNPGMRLDRFLAMSGYGSRADVRQLIRSGRVRVNAAAVSDPGFRLSDSEPPAVTVDGRGTVFRRWIHLMLHKPAGVVTALEDARHPTVADFIPEGFRNRGVSPVGRLDIDVTGLLLLTSDGVLGHRLASPRWEIDKTYHVLYEGPPFTEEDVRIFAEGLELEDGTCCRPARLEPEGNESAFLTIHEGRFHQVKIMMIASGRRVVTLRRLQTGPLVLDAGLEPGACRELTQTETAALYAAVDLDPDREE